MNQTPRTIPPPPEIVVLQSLPPYSIEYADTSNYYWPLLSENKYSLDDETSYAGPIGYQLPDNDTSGPFGFGEAVQPTENKCIIKSNFGHKHDKCIVNPKGCKKGLSLSIWEKVSYQDDVLNVLKDHDKKYVFSTGGDYQDDNLYPGVGIYHQGMDLIAVVSTDEDVWELRVRGQLVNETWSNIGIRWAPYVEDSGLPYEKRGGLELYVNAEKVGHAIKPLDRPNGGEWNEEPVLSPGAMDRTWRRVAKEPPIAMIGCHRTSNDTEFRDFCRPNTVFDELAIWTRKLEVNRTHNEVLYFTAGYDPQFEGLSLDTWTEMLDRVELHDPGQMEIAGLIAGKFAAAAGGGDVAAASAILPSLDPENTQSLDLNSFSPSAGKSDKIYPRTPKEKADYDRQGLAYEGARKLLNGDGLKIIEKPRYLTKRYSVFGSASLPLADTQDNIKGWGSVMLDPDEEGSSKLVKRIEKYALYYLNSADLREDEDFPGYFDTDHPMMMFHSHSSALTMTSVKVQKDGLKQFGNPNDAKQLIDIKKFAASNSVNNFTDWNNHPEDIEIPSTFKFKNQSLCGNTGITVMTALYDGYGKMAPLRRNPQSIRAKEIKIDSNPVSVKILVAPDPNHPETAEELRNCKLDNNEMRYHPVKVRFFHLDKQTALRKLLWHEDDLDTNIEVRKCVVYNEDIGRYGAWDADKCTTVLSEQHSTVCECYTDGTFAVVAEIVEPPAYGPEYDWLWVVKYIGYAVSIVMLLVFITVVFINPFLWEMFHIIRCNSAFCIFAACLCMFVAENSTIRKDRHDNITVSVFQQYWFLASSLSLLSESFATFRAITGGIIGGKTWGYIPMIYGIPLIDIGVTMLLYGDDYGRDPRAFIGWANDTKMIFFYGQLVTAGLAVLLCSVIMFNISVPKTRKDSVVEQLTSQSTGLTIMVMIYGMTWGFAFPAYIRFPDKETPDFFPIFQVLNAWSGVFVMLFLGMSSSRFRAGIFGTGSLSGSPLFKYMVNSKRRKAHATAFASVIGGDIPSGLTSKFMSTESLNTGQDSLDDDIEKGKEDDVESYDSLDDDSIKGKDSDASESSEDSLDGDSSGDGDDSSDNSDDDEDDDDDKEKSDSD